MEKGFQLRDRVARLESCPREDRFRAMYRALGDAERQDELRIVGENVRHCPMLRKSPSACECLPQDFDAKARKGDVCPRNPYVLHAEVFRKFQEYDDLLDDVRDLVDVARMGLLPPLSEITPRQFLMLRLGLDADRASAPPSLNSTND